MSKNYALRIVCIMLALALVVSAALTFVACGKNEVTEYTVTFYVDGEVYASITTDGTTAITLPDNPTKEGYTFAGWVMDQNGDQAFDRTAAVQGNLSVYAKWTDSTTPTPATKYTVTFEVDGKTYQTLTIEAGATLTLPAVPTKEGYTFAGWVLADGTAFAGRGVTADITVTAKWTENTAEPQPQYTVTFVVDGTTYNTAKAAADGTVALPTAPTKEGYTFAGWVLADGTAFAGRGVTADVTVTAKWTENTAEPQPQYTVTFVVDGAAYNTAKADANGTVALPTAPTKQGYAFEGWVLADGTAFAGRGVTADATVTAKWTALYTVTFVTGSNAQVEPVVVKAGSKIEAPLFNGSRAGYTFAYWDYDFANAITSDVTITAHWNLVYYTIRYAEAGKHQNPETYTVESEDIVLAAPAAKEGYTFAGWTGTGLNQATLEVTIAKGSVGDRVYTAQWTGNLHTVYLDPDYDQQTVTTVQVRMGEEFVFAVPNRDFYDFGGWYIVGGTYYTDEAGAGLQPWDIDEDITMYARWSPKKYDVKLDLNGGVSEESTQIKLTYKASFSIFVPTRVGYTFAGWYIGDAGYTDNQGNSTQVWNKTDDTYILTAHWFANLTTVHFDANGGVDIVGDQVEYDAQYTFATTTRKGYVFGGWAYDGQAVTDGNGALLSAWNIDLAEVTLSALWTEGTYAVSFDLKGGSGKQDTIYITTGQDWPVIAIGTEKAGYTFDGYYSSEDNHIIYDDQGQPKHQIVLGADLEVYAKWTACTYQITFAPTLGSTAYTKADVVFGQVPTALTEEQLPTCEGYTFTGYFDATTGGTKYFNRDGSAVDEPYAVPDNITLYAQWKNGIYSVRFYANVPDGVQVTGSMPDQDVELHVETAIDKNNYARAGYNFVGWNTAADGSGDDVADQAVILDKASANGYYKLYAKWAAITYTVKAGEQQQEITFDTDFSFAPVEQTGYTFDGWYYGDVAVTAADGAGLTVWSIAEDATLTAKWTANKYIIDLMAWGEKVGSITATYGQPMPTVYGTPITTGYIFDGYYSAQEGGVQYYNDRVVSAHDWDLTEQKVLYAQFHGIDYQITIYPGSGESTQGMVTVIFGSYAPDIDPNKFYYIGRAFMGAQTYSGVLYYDADGKATRPWDINHDTTLTAIWEKVDYTVTFDVNGGVMPEDAPESYTIQYDDYTYKFPVPTRTGYSFDGWYLDEMRVADTAGEHTTYWPATQNVEVKAVWIAHTKYVTFNEVGGNYQHNAIKVTYGQPMPTLEGYGAKTGYTFVGYDYNGVRYYAVNQSGFYYSAHDWDVDTDDPVTLVAQWQPRTFTIYFDPHGANATVKATQITATYNAALPELTEDYLPVYPDFVFNGWSDSTGVLYYDGTLAAVKDTFTSTSNVYLEGRWTLAQYTIEYNANGGTGSMSDQVKERTKYFYLPANTFSREGYTFAGWNTQADGSGTAYANGAYTNNVGPAGGKVTLYAQWNGIGYKATLHNEEQVYIVDFDLNGAEGVAPATQVVTSSEGLQYPDLPTRAGYAFGGWFTDAEGTGNAFAFNKAVTADTTLYAKWCEVEKTPITFGVEYPVTIDGSAKYYAFCTLETGYVTVSVGRNAQIYYYKRGNWGYGTYKVYSYKGTVEYFCLQQYASYGEHVGDTTFTVTAVMPSDGGTAQLDQTFDVVYGSQETQYPVCTRTGYTFAGWYGSVGGTGTQYADGDGKVVTPWDTAGDATLYAGWTANQYKLSFDTNNGTGAQADVWATFDSTVPAITVAPTRDDYDFAGYWSAKEGGVLYYDADLNALRAWQVADNATLYAQWTGKPYTVKFDSNADTTGEMTDQVLLRNTDMALKANGFVRAGYSFASWNTAKDGSGTSYADGATVNNLSTAGVPVTLYARWTANTYKVSLNDGRMQSATLTFNLNYDGGVAPTAQTIKDEETLDYPDLPTRDGYLFGGWYTDTECTELFDFAASLTDNVTVYAKWVEIPEGADVWSLMADKAIEVAANKVIGYYFIVPLATPLTVYATSGFDSCGYLYDAKKSQLIYNDDNTTLTGGNNFGWTYDVVPGTAYYVGVRGYGDGACGDLTLHTKGDVVPADGGMSGKTIMAVNNATYDSTFTLDTPSARAHYTFDGWYDGEGGTGNKLTGNDGKSVGNWTIASNTTVYAHWTGEKHQVSFSAEGGSDNEAVTAEYGAAMPTVTVPTKSKQVFMGYFTAAIGGVQYYGEDGKSARNSDFTDNVTLYAQWANEPYYIVFNVNGENVEGTMATQLIRRDIETALTTIAYTRRGYNFTGWNTAADGSGDPYTNGQAVTNICDSFGTLTLYAQWKAQTTRVYTRDGAEVKYHPYTLSFDLNGAPGVAPDDQVVGHDGDGAQYPTTIPEWSGHLFGGWYKEPDCLNKFNFAYSNDYDITVYAKWYEVTYIPVVPGKDYTITVTDSPVYYCMYALVNNPITITVGLDAYIYDTGLNYFGNGSCTIVNAFSSMWNFYVHSKNNKTGDGYTGETTLRVEISGGNLPGGGGLSDRLDVERKVLTYDQDFTLNKPEDIVNYTFEGWYSSSGGTGTQYTDSDGNSVRKWDVADTATMVLYAYYRGVVCTVTYDKQGGNGGTDSAVAYYREGVPMASQPKRTGYEFMGYYDGVNGTGTQYYTETMTSAHNWDKTTDTTLYAYWVAKKYTVVLNGTVKETCSVSFNLNGADGDAPATQNVGGETALTYPDIPTRSGYVFTGWYIEAECRNKYNFAANVDYDRVLYAGWKAVPGWSGSNVAELGDVVDVTIDGQTKQYYVFAVRKTQTVRFYTSDSSEGVDTYGHLYYYSQMQIKEYDYGGDDKNFNFTYELEPGVYVIAVRDNSVGKSGTCKLHIEGNAKPADGGTHDSSKEERVWMTYDADYSLSVPSRDGYTFVGWFDEYDNQYTDDNGDSIAAWTRDVSTTTLYAHWEEA